MELLLINIPTALIPLVDQLSRKERRQVYGRISRPAASLLCPCFCRTIPCMIRYVFCFAQLRIIHSHRPQEPVPHSIHCDPPSADPLLQPSLRNLTA